MSNEFAVDPEAAKSIGNPTSTSDAVKLPFITMDLWWKRAISGATGGVREFGGWASNIESVDGWNTQYPEMPANMVGPEVWKAERGPDTYSVYSTRQIWVAPVARRFGWFLKQNGDKNNKKDFKSSLNYLCYAANIDLRTKSIVALGPVVLSAKSKSGQALDEAFKSFASATAQARKDHANNAPAHFFFSCIGTFGTAPNWVTVGSGNDTNEITPPMSWVPSDISVDYLKLTFVNPEIQKIMAGMAKDAEEWVADWKRGNKSEAQEAQPQAEGGRVEFTGDTIGTGSVPEDDIPF